MAYVTNWIAFAISIVVLAWYAYEALHSACGWEEVYVCVIETFNVTFEIFAEFEEPLTVYLSSGMRVPFLRYTEWLLSCPVILIHLSNLSGLSDGYNKRTMLLLVTLIGCLVTGVYSAMCYYGWIKWAMYTVSCIYCAFVYWYSAKVYVETYHMVPKGRARTVVLVMASIFFTTWGIVYPLLFALGPEGLNAISFHLSNFLHCIADLFSKLLWGALGHQLRIIIHKHILQYGDIRKKTKVGFGTDEMEVATMIEPEEADETAERLPVEKYLRRPSFARIRNQLKQQGKDIYPDLDRDSMYGSNSSYTGGRYLDFADPDFPDDNYTPIPFFAGGGDLGLQAAAAAGSPQLAPGRIVLVVPETARWMVEFMRHGLSALPAPFEIIPTIGGGAVMQLTQMGTTAPGGLEAVLMHSYYARTGLVSKLRMRGVHVVIFGYSPSAPDAAEVQAAGADQLCEGYSMAPGSNGLKQLISALANFQAQAGKLPDGGSGGAGRTGGAAAGFTGSPSPPPPSSTYGGASMMMAASAPPPQAAPASIRMTSTTGGTFGISNPLFGMPPVAQELQPGLYSAPRSGTATPPNGPAGGNATGDGGAAEAAMLQSLLGEIAKLRSELGEN
ncbi:hypothetical protein HYH02_012242 [Chlamydomonas schloesseri]|uniref:Channelopsin 1 n=1 Tax=Chlamydomonas schloesseri TaxID=2026947 RepID=A0A835W281_9CHLO|nr:hypothetical protein HYH02_012242 [Chlamydomonas schloesseri]|eukprot:KAG2434578.1 hypothetical protein HYH02_012242 [Chlamydomonas schloesseri]